MDTHGPNPPFWVQAAHHSLSMFQRQALFLCGQDLTWSEDAAWVGEFNFGVHHWEAHLVADIN